MDRACRRQRLGFDALAVQLAKLFELGRQSMTQRARRAEFFQKGFGLFEADLGENSALKQLGPATRDFTFG